MYLCMCVYIYTYIYIYICLFTCIHVYVYIYTYAVLYDYAIMLLHDCYNSYINISMCLLLVSVVSSVPAWLLGFQSR